MYTPVPVFASECPCVPLACMYMHVFVHMLLYVPLYACGCLGVYAHVQHVPMYVHLPVCACEWGYLHVPVWTCIHVCASYV